MKAWAIKRTDIIEGYPGQRRYTVDKYIIMGNVIRVRITEIKPRKRKGKI